VSSARRAFLAITLALGLASITVETGAAEGATSCGTWRPVWSPNPAGANWSHGLGGVAALSPSNVIAVGASYRIDDPFDRARTVAERWDGRSWAAMSPISPGESAVFNDVARITDSSAWAVGAYDHGTEPLIERLSGDTWTTVASGSGSDTSLSDVDVISASDAWASGIDGDGRAFMLHWDGRRWRRVDIQPTGGLLAVDMSSSDDGWAVGYRYPVGQHSESRTMIQRWDGIAWRRVPSPNGITGAEAGNSLSGVAARSATDAFAVGRSVGPEGSRALVLHWNGTAWTQVFAAAFERGAGAFLTDVVNTSDGTYAVGQFRGEHGRSHPLIVRWDGTNWSRMRVAAGSDDPHLSSVAAVSRASIIAVGSRMRGGRTKTFALHCTP
jgi:hypothetical protein